MRTIFTITLIYIMQFSIALATDSITLSDQADRINYSIGHQIGTDFKRQKILLNDQAVRQGIIDGESGTTPLVDKKEMNSSLADLKKNITEKMKTDAQKRIHNRREREQEIRAQGAAFMQANAQQPGVISLPSGLQYRIIKAGHGEKPSVNDFVTFNYRAKTVQGREYDSSYKKGKPATYRANSVLPGFTQVIQMMQPGAIWEVVLPSEQAYGRQGPLAHQTIILEIELLSIDWRKEN